MSKAIANKVFQAIARWPALRLIVLSIFPLPWKENKKVLFGWKVEVIKMIESFALQRKRKNQGFCLRF